ncbi:hypothetical protein [Legionella sp. WA2022007384]
MLRGGKFFKDSLSETDYPHEQTGLSIESLPNEMLLPILQKARTTRKDKNNMSLVSKWFRELNEAKPLGTSQHYDIDFIIESLLRDLYRMVFNPCPAGIAQLSANKELLPAIEQLKKQLLAVLKAGSFEKIDRATFALLFNGDTKTIRSNLLIKHGGLLPYVIESVNDFQFLAATVDKSQWNAIEVIFRTIKINEKNDLTTRIHLMLRICAELKNNKSQTENHRKYRQMLINTCHQLASLSEEQNMVAMEMINEGIRLSEEINLHNLTNTFIVVRGIFNEQLGEEAGYDMRSQSKPFR